MPVPTISPSPCTAWQSPRKNRAPGDGHRKPHGRARAEAPIVHVAAVFGAGGGGKACPIAGATPKQPIIGSSGSIEVLEPGDGGSERRRQRLPVDPPVGRVARRQVAARTPGRRRCRRATRGSSRWRGSASCARSRPSARRPARRPVDEDRPVHRVGARPHAARRPCRSPLRVEGFGDHRVARLDREGGRQGAEHVVPARGDRSDASSWSDCVAQRRRLGKDQPSDRKP